MEFPRTRGRTNLKVWLLYGEVAVLDETRRYRKLKLPQGQNPARGTISRNIVSYLGEPAALKILLVCALPGQPQRFCTR